MSFLVQFICILVSCEMCFPHELFSHMNFRSLFHVFNLDIGCNNHLAVRCSVKKKTVDASCYKMICGSVHSAHIKHFVAFFWS